MKVFVALDLYDNIVRVARTRELAEQWLMTRVTRTWQTVVVEHCSWEEVSKGTVELESGGSSWPYRIIEQNMLGTDIPTPRDVHDNIIRGTD